MERIPSREELYNNLLDKYESIGLYNTTGNAFVPKLIETQLTPYNELVSVIEDIQDNMFLTTAYGDSLDKHGYAKNIPRLEGSYPYDTSSQNFKIYLSNGALAKNVTVDGGGIFIPANTKIYGASVAFMTIEAAYIDPDQNETYCGVVGTEITDAPIPANTLTSLSITPSQITNANQILLAENPLQCTNLFPIQPGTYKERDNDYKVRLVESLKSYNPKMESSIRAMALSVPGVVDISLYSNTHGIGTKSLVVLTREPFVSDGIIAAVSAAISDLSDSSVIVMKPEYLTVSVTNSITYITEPTDVTSIKAQISAKQKDYINNLRNGQTLSYEQLNTLAKEVDNTIKSATVTCLKINNRIVSLADQICGWDEKFVTVDTDTESAIKFTV